MNMRRDLMYIRRSHMYQNIELSKINRWRRKYTCHSRARSLVPRTSDDLKLIDARQAGRVVLCTRNLKFAL